MNKSEVDKSLQSLHPALDLFSAAPTVTGVESSRYVEYNTTSAPETRPFEFRVMNNKAFLNLANSYIISRYRLLDENGFVLQDLDGDNFATCNFLGGSLFKQVQVYIGGKLIYDLDNYNYSCYLSALLSHSSEYKKTFLKICGYSEDEDLTNAADPLFTARHNREKGGKEQEVVTPLWFPPAQQNKAIIPYVDLRIVCFPSSDEFLIDRRLGNKKVKVEIISTTLVLHEIHTPNSLVLSLDKLLRDNGPVNYTSLATTVRSVFIQPGIRHMPPFKIFANTIPRRIFVALVSAKGFSGSYDSHPYDFRNYDVQNVRLQAGSEVMPFNEFQCSFDDDLYARAFMGLQQTLGVSGTGVSNGLSPEAFKKQCCVFGFDTSGYDPELHGLQRVGDCSISFSFSADVPAPGLYAIIMAETVSNLLIGADRVAHVY